MEEYMVEMWRNTNYIICGGQVCARIVYMHPFKADRGCARMMYVC